MGTNLNRRNFLLTGATTVAGLALMSGEAKAQQDQDLLSGINKAKDMQNPSGLELKHVPVLELPSNIAAGEPFSLKITVGKNLHPMEREHFIQWVQVFVNDVWIAQALLSPEHTQPIVEFSIILKDPGKIRAEILCNKHGVWENEVEVSF